MLKLALFFAIAFLGYRLVKQVRGQAGETRELSGPGHRPSRFDSTQIVDAEYEDLEGVDEGE